MSQLRDYSSTRLEKRRSPNFSTHFLGLTIQKDEDSSAKVDPANAYHRLRPTKILIFLCVRHDDPSTAYYYLSIPEEDVGATTG